MVSENASGRPLRFDWFDDELPAGPLSEAQRSSLGAVIGGIGWEAVLQGDFEPLTRLYRDFVSLYPRLLVDHADLDRAAQLYALLYTMLWRRTEHLSELKRFNADVVRPFSDFVARLIPRQPLAPSNHEVPRIAWLSETSDLFGSNAIARITVSLMLGQQELRDEADWPILYCINRPAPCLKAFAEQHGLRVRDMARDTPSRTAGSVVAQTRQDRIDILIADSNCAVATMVFQQRAATVQVFHENGFAPWAIPELDLALLGITPPSPDLFGGRVAMASTPRNTAFVFQRQPRPPEMIDAVREALCAQSGVARPSVVYGVYGRMGKINADYMARVEEILAADPAAIFFAGGTGPIAPITDLMAASPVADRMVIYNAFIDGHVISDCIDIFLDTSPFPGGMSCIEVQARGVPVIWMKPTSEDELCIIAEQRDHRLLARDGDHYVELARQAADPAAWGGYSDAAFEIARRHGDMREQAMLVEEHLRAAWAKARSGVRLTV